MVTPTVFQPSNSAQISLSPQKAELQKSGYSAPIISTNVPQQDMLISSGGSQGPAGTYTAPTSLGQFAQLARTVRPAQLNQFVELARLSVVSQLTRFAETAPQERISALFGLFKSADIGKLSSAPAGPDSGNMESPFAKADNLLSESSLINAQQTPFVQTAPSQPFSIENGQRVLEDAYARAMAANATAEAAKASYLNLASNLNEAAKAYKTQIGAPGQQVPFPLTNQSLNPDVFNVPPGSTASLPQFPPVQPGMQAPSEAYLQQPSPFSPSGQPSPMEVPGLPPQTPQPGGETGMPGQQPPLGPEGLPAAPPGQQQPPLGPEGLPAAPGQKPPTGPEGQPIEGQQPPLPGQEQATPEAKPGQPPMGPEGAEQPPISPEIGQPPSAMPPEGLLPPDLSSLPPEAIEQMLTQPPSLDDQVNAMLEVGKRNLATPTVIQTLENLALTNTSSIADESDRKHAMKVQQAAIWTLGWLVSQQPPGKPTKQMPGMATFKKIIKDKTQSPIIKMAVLEALNLSGRNDNFVKGLFKKAASSKDPALSEFAKQGPNPMPPNAMAMTSPGQTPDAGLAGTPSGETENQAGAGGNGTPDLTAIGGPGIQGPAAPGPGIQGPGVPGPAGNGMPQLSEADMKALNEMLAGLPAPPAGNPSTGGVSPNAPQQPQDQQQQKQPALTGAGV